MEWVKSLKGKTVGLDTAPLIYFIEENPVYLDTVRHFFEAADRGVFSVVTSTITLLEVLVHPFRKNDAALADEYRDILLHSNLITTTISNSISEKAAKLRASHNIRTPDAIQIATALDAGASHFLTNDADLPEIPEIQIVFLDKLLA